MSKCICGDFYCIQKGESLKNIAARNGMSLSDLLAANPYLDPAHYVCGQIILLPTQTREMRAKKHTVAKGEALWQILQRYEISARELQQLNREKDVLNLHEGDEIYIS